MLKSLKYSQVFYVCSSSECFSGDGLDEVLTQISVKKAEGKCYTKLEDDLVWFVGFVRVCMLYISSLGAILTCSSDFLCKPLTSRIFKQGFQPAESKLYSMSLPLLQHSLVQN